MGGYGSQVISSLSPDWFQDHLTVITKCISDQHTLLWERSGYQTGWFFGKVPRGWGSLSIQKFIVQILGTLSRFFWAWNWYIQKSNFRVKGIFFQQLYCITPISGNDVHAFHTIWPPYLIYATISIIKDLQYNLPKMRGGGQSLLELFQKFILFGSRALPLFPCCFPCSIRILTKWPYWSGKVVLVTVLLVSDSDQVTTLPAIKCICGGHFLGRSYLPPQVSLDLKLELGNLAISNQHFHKSWFKVGVNTFFVWLDKVENLLGNKSCWKFVLKNGW